MDRLQPDIHPTLSLEEESPFHHRTAAQWTGWFVVLVSAVFFSMIRDARLRNPLSMSRERFRILLRDSTVRNNPVSPQPVVSRKDSPDLPSHPRQENHWLAIPAEPVRIVGLEHSRQPSDLPEPVTRSQSIQNASSGPAPPIGDSETLSSLRLQSVAFMENPASGVPNIVFSENGCFPNTEHSLYRRFSCQKILSRAPPTNI